MLLHYDFLSKFKHIFYKDLLTEEHVASGLIELPKLSYENEDETGKFWGWILEKNGEKFLLSYRDNQNNERNINNMLPLIPRDCIKVSSKGTVYKWINRPIVMKIRPVNTMTFKEFVDKLSGLKHSNEKHKKLFWFMGLAQMFDRANFRVSTPAGFGKDSVVDILGSLIGGSATLENPTLAKLEFMTSYKWLAVNEVVGISPGEWRMIEQFLLATGAHKSEVTKHSRASDKTKEILKVMHFSLSLMYNDIDHYPEPEKYFDFVTKGAVKDRFPAFRLYGTYQEDFNSIQGINANTFVETHKEEYLQLIRQYYYTKGNLHSLKHGYNTRRLNKMSERWQTNVGRLLNMIDMYCDTQEEFDEWIEVINDSILDYKSMLLYPKNMEKLETKLSSKDFTTFQQQLKATKTFIRKNELITNRLNGKFEEVKEPEFWDKFK